MFNCGSILVVALFYSFTLLFFDTSAIVPQFVNQFVSRSYPSAMGYITQSEVRRHVGSKGRVAYGVNIRYRYVVDGHEFESARFRYNDSLSDSLNLAWIQKTVTNYPVGSSVNVFYNQKDPAIALLSTGINGDDIMFILSSIPFYMVLLGLWIIPAEWLIRLIFKPEAGGVKVYQRDHCIHVQLPRIRPILVFAATVGGLSAFFSIIIQDNHPSLDATAIILAIVVGIGCAIYYWLLRIIRTGYCDLIIDENMRSVSLPKGFGRKKQLSISISDINNVTVNIVAHLSSNKGQTSISYAPTLLLHGNESYRIADWMDQGKAEEFVRWLSRQIGLTA